MEPNESNAAAPASGIAVSESSLGAEEFSASVSSTSSSLQESGRPAGWGSKYFPPVPRASERDRYMRLLEEILLQIDSIRLTAGDEQEISEGTVANIEAAFEELYECQWGNGNCLKMIVVDVLAQIRRVKWTRGHVMFVASVTKAMRARYTIDAGFVESCRYQMEEHDLNPLRGTFGD